MTTNLETVYSGTRVCVTGGAGFIGSHLCDALVKLGAEVSVLDDLSSGTTANLQAIQDRVRLVTGSILDPAALVDATSGVSMIFHQAALTSVPASLENPLQYHEVNATGTLRVLEAARLAPRTGDAAPRVVYASSSSAYGDRDREPLAETLTPRPMSPYATAKVAGELMLRAYSACYDVSTVSLRYFNIFGQRQRPDSPYAAVIPRFAEALLRGEAPTVYGDGTQTRDYTHVANAVRGNLLAGASARPLRGEIVNIACGTGTSLLELLDRMGRTLNVQPQPVFAPPRVGEVLHSCADVSAAHKLLGYEPAMDLDAGLADALEYYKKLAASDG